VSAATAILAAALPKCPLCWMTLAGALGVGPFVTWRWVRPLAAGLLLLSVGALFLHARRLNAYGPFWLGLLAAVSIYACKFGLGYDPGVYLGGATLIGASLWNALPGRRAARAARCRC
jgi:hypothetical protein